jgi:hypothetical protein
MASPYLTASISSPEKPTSTHITAKLKAIQATSFSLLSQEVKSAYKDQPIGMRVIIIASKWNGVSLTVAGKSKKNKINRATLTPKRFFHLLVSG